MKGPDLEVNHPRECVLKEAKSLADIVKSGGASYEALIRKAIEDEQMHGDLSASMMVLFSEGSDDDRLLAISVAGHLGDRRFAEHLTKLLAAVLESRRQLPAWGIAAIELVSELTLPSDPKRVVVFKGCIARPDTRLAGWRLSQKMDAEFTIPFVSALLVEHPTEARNVAIKFALIWQDACELLAEEMRGWRDVPPETIAVFMETMETYLMRVRRVRLWRNFERIATGRAGQISTSR